MRIVDIAIALALITGCAAGQVSPNSLPDKTTIISTKPIHVKGVFQIVPFDPDTFACPAGWVRRISDDRKYGECLRTGQWAERLTQPEANSLDGAARSTALQTRNKVISAHKDADARQDEETRKKAIAKCKAELAQKPSSDALCATTFIVGYPFYGKPEIIGTWVRMSWGDYEPLTEDEIGKIDNADRDVARVEVEIAKAHGVDVSGRVASVCKRYPDTIITIYPLACVEWDGAPNDPGKPADRWRIEGGWLLVNFPDEQSNPAPRR
jgi:hypothetical protein